MPQHPHMSPMLPCASVCSRGFLMWYGDVGSSCLDTPMCLDASSCPTHLYAPLYVYVLGGYLHVLWGNTPYVGGSRGFSTSVRLLVSVSASIGCPLCFISHLSCSSLCLKSLLPWLQLLLLQWLWCLLICHLYYWWPWLLLDGAPYNIGSAWCGSASTSDTKMCWRGSWPCLCATAATSIFNAISGLCQLCHGFSTGRFLFQSWPSHHFVYYMFGVCCLLSGAMLDAIFTPRGSTIGVCTIATPWSLPMAGIHSTPPIKKKNMWRFPLL